MICQLVIGSCSKLSMTRRFAQTTLADELSLGEVTETELLRSDGLLLARQERVENDARATALARGDGGFVFYDLSSAMWRGAAASWRRWVHAVMARAASCRSTRG